MILTDHPQISLCLISFNEVEGLSYLLPQLMKFEKTYFNEIIAIDGGSTDGSLEQYNKHQIKYYIQHNQGRGSAIQQAVELAQSQFVILFSPDGNEDLNDLVKFSNFFKQDYDLVIASRMMEGALNEEDHHYLKWRKWANLTFNYLAHLLFNRNSVFITDSINGFRGFKKTLFKELKIDAKKYDIEYQLTIRSLRHRKKIIEFPTIENQRRGGVSKVKSIQAGLVFLKRLFIEIIN